MELARSGSVLLVVLVASASLVRASQRTGADPGEARNPPDLIEILVVDRDGDALPTAEVRFAVEDERAGAIHDESEPDGWRQAFYLQVPPPPDSVDRLLERRPVVHPSATGKVRILWPLGRGLLVSGRRADEWGFLWLPRDWRETAGRAHRKDEPHLLELVPDWELTVVVSDERGEPLENVPARLACERRFGRSSGFTGTSRFVYEHLGYRLAGASEPLTVSIDTLLDPPVQERVDPHRPPAGPIVLRMPPSGSVKVQVLDPDGRISAEGGLVRLQFAPLPTSQPGRRLEMLPDVPHVVEFAWKGTAVFEGVSLDREIDVVLQGIPAVVAKTRVRGPTSPGETVQVSIRLGSGIQPRESTSEAGTRSRAGARSASGILRGFLLLDPGVPVEELNVRVEPGGSPLLEPDGKFSISVAPGPARLEIWPSAAQILRPEDRPILFQTDLVIAPGENADPRLACIDLRGKVHAHRIQLTGVDPEREFHATVDFGPSGGWSPKRCHDYIWLLPLVLVSPWESIDVELFAPGYRSVSLQGLRERIELELEPAIPVKLRLHTDGVLPEPPRYLKAVLVPLDQPRTGIDWEGPAFGASREISTFAWKPGRMKVTWIDARYEEDMSSGAVREVYPPQYVEVFDTDQVQVFEVHITAAEIERILREGD